MSAKQISVLLISPDEQIYSAIEGSLAGQANCRFNRSSGYRNRG